MLQSLYLLTKKKLQGPLRLFYAINRPAQKKLKVHSIRILMLFQAIRSKELLERELHTFKFVHENWFYTILLAQNILRNF